MNNEPTLLPAAPALRLTDRNRLLNYLSRLGHPDPERRAHAAAQAAHLLQKRGIGWADILPGLPNEPDEPPADWRETARSLREHPDLSRDERDALGKLLGWRAPGQPGLRLIREITARVGGRAASRESAE